MSCNVICYPTFECGGLQKPKPIVGAVYAPFVTVNLGGRITVGNKSFPAQPHTAVIKSFEYGGSDGCGATIEIIDESGSAFGQHYDNLNDDLCEAPDDYKVSIDFGWLARSCDGSITKMGIPDGPVYGVPQSAESTYEGGKIKYTIKVVDLMGHMGENRIEAPIGTEANRVPVGQAMRQIFSRNCPRVNNVRRVRVRGTNLQEWRFRNSDGGNEGPSGVWPADQQNALQAVRKWSLSLTTDRKKGYTPVWNPGSPQPELWFVEDPRNYCDESPSQDNCLGTYIVNGGDCSPVISFSPTAKWTFSAELGSGGGSGGATSGRTVKNRPIPGRFCNDESQRVGTTSQMPAPQNDINWRPPDQVVERLQQGLAAQELAAQFMELTAPIEAELKIWGDPRFVHPVQWTGKKVGIIVINPFYIYSGNYCEWLAGPMCNPVYSDKEYMVLGVNHQIKEGSYQTTLKVVLSNPQKTKQ